MFRPVTVCCLALLSALPVDSSAQSPAAWSRTLPGSVVRMQPAPGGLSLIQTKAGLVAIDPATGRDVWTRPDVTEAVPVDGRDLLIATLPGGERVLDATTGRDRWAVDTLGLKTVRGTIGLPAQDLLLVYGESPDGGHALIAAAIADGTVRWRQTALYREPALLKHAPKMTYRSWLVDSETTIVLDPDDDGLVRLDLATGTVRWRLAEAALPSKGKPVALERAADHLLVRYDRRLFALAADAGTVAWTREENFPSPVAQVASTPSGLLVRGSHTVNAKGHVSWKPYLTLLDPSSGATLWTTEGTKFKGRSPFLLEGDTVTLALEEGVAAYELATGRERRVVAMKEFEGGEYPTSIERGDDGGLILRSSQNVRHFDAALSPTASVYLKAPGMSFMAKFAMVALAAAATTMSASMATPGQFYTVYSPDSAWLTAKFRATSLAARFTYVFCEEPGSHADRFALVRLDRATAQETGRLTFTDRSPSLLVDPATGAVILGDGTTLRGYQYAAAPEPAPRR